MNKYINEQGSAVLITIIVLVILASIGAYAVSKNNNSKLSGDEMMENNLPVNDDTMMVEDENAMMVEGDTIQNDGDMIVEDDQDTMMEDNDSMMVSVQGIYQDYSQANYEAAKDKKRVLFFHASWCPTCKAAHISFEKNLDKLPDNVVLLKTDYDSEKALKDKYGITYQHTFVQVDKDGNAIKVWNGGSIDELINNVL